MCWAQVDSPKTIGLIHDLILSDAPVPDSASSKVIPTAVHVVACHAMPLSYPIQLQ